MEGNLEKVSIWAEPSDQAHTSKGGKGMKNGFGSGNA
jgi:hypothetical protein